MNQLVSCETPSGVAWAYAYDPFGRRVSKRRVLSEAEQVWVRGRFPALVRSVSSGGRSALDVWPDESLSSVVTDHLGTSWELFGEGVIFRAR